MARADECDDVGAQILLAHAASGFGVLRLEQQRENVARRRAAVRDQLATRGDDVVDRACKPLQCLLTAQPAEARQELRQA